MAKAVLEDSSKNCCDYKTLADEESGVLVDSFDTLEKLVSRPLTTNKMIFDVVDKDWFRLIITAGVKSHCNCKQQDEYDIDVNSIIHQLETVINKKLSDRHERKAATEIQREFQVSRLETIEKKKHKKHKKQAQQSQGQFESGLKPIASGKRITMKIVEKCALKRCGQRPAKTEENIENYQN